MLEMHGNTYVIGGLDSSGAYQSSIYQLSCSSGLCSWSTLNQQLKNERYKSVAIAVQDNFCIPINTTTTSKKFYNYFDQYRCKLTEYEIKGIIDVFDTNLKIKGIIDVLETNLKIKRIIDVFDTNLIFLQQLQQPPQPLQQPLQQPL